MIDRVINSTFLSSNIFHPSDEEYSSRTTTISFYENEPTFFKYFLPLFFRFFFLLRFFWEVLHKLTTLKLITRPVIN